MVGVRRKLSAGRRLRTRSGREALRPTVLCRAGDPAVCGWVSTLVGTPPESLRLGINPGWSAPESLRLGIKPD